MGNKGQTILVVSDDAALCAAARKEFEPNIAGLRVASVTSVAAAHRILEDGAPAVILLEEAAIGPESDGPRETVPRLDAVVTSLAVYAPVVVIGRAERRAELSALLDAGAADYVMRDGRGCLPSALGLVRSRLRHAQDVAADVVGHLVGAFDNRIPGLRVGWLAVWVGAKRATGGHRARGRYYRTNHTGRPEVPQAALIKPSATSV